MKLFNSMCSAALVLILSFLLLPTPGCSVDNSLDIHAAFCAMCYEHKSPSCWRLCISIPKVVQSESNSPENFDIHDDLCNKWCREGRGGSFCNCDGNPPAFADLPKIKSKSKEEL